jgi:polysaccharide biosynthesis/export protein
MLMRIQSAVAVISALITLAGCGHSAPFVWVDSLRLPAAAAPSAEALISAGDVVSIQVWEQENMTTRGRVREDGKISFPLLRDVALAGKTPGAAAAEIETALKPFVLAPRVTVVVEEPKPLSVSVLGQVGQPGQYVMERGAGVAQVLAAAGGLSAFAKKDKIFVLRESAGKQQRIRFRFRSLTDPSSAAARFRVQAGDLVVVE